MSQDGVSNVLVLVGDPSLSRLVCAALTHPRVTVAAETEERRINDILGGAHYDLVVLGGRFGKRGPLVLCELVRVRQQGSLVLLLHGAETDEQLLRDHRGRHLPDVEYLDLRGSAPAGDTGAFVRELALEMLTQEEDAAAAQGWQARLEQAEQLAAEQARAAQVEPPIEPAAGPGPLEAPAEAEPLDEELPLLSPEALEALPPQVVTDDDVLFADRLVQQMRRVDFRSPLPKVDLPEGPDRTPALLRERVRELERHLARLAHVYTGQKHLVATASYQIEQTETRTRAAEEQVGRTREKLEEVNALHADELSRLRADVQASEAGWHERLGRIKEEILRLKTAVDDQASALAERDRALEALRGELGSREAELARLGDLQREITAAVERAGANELTATLAPQLSALETITRQASEQLVEIRAQLVSAQRAGADDVVEQRQALARLEQSHREVAARLEEAVAARVAELGERLAPLDQVGERLASLDQVGERLASLDQVGERLASLDQVAERVASLDQVAERVASLDQVAERVAAIEELARGGFDRVAGLGDLLTSGLEPSEGLASRLSGIEEAARLSHDGARRVLEQVEQLGARAAEQASVTQRMLADVSAAGGRASASNQSGFAAHQRRLALAGFVAAGAAFAAAVVAVVLAVTGRGNAAAPEGAMVVATPAALSAPVTVRAAAINAASEEVARRAATNEPAGFPEAEQADAEAGDEPQAAISPPAGEPSAAPAAAPSAAPAAAPSAAPAAASASRADRKELRRNLFDAVKTKDWRAASAAGLQLMEHFDIDWEAEMKLAGALLKAGRPDDAIRVLQDFARRFPDNKFVDSAMMMLGDTLVQRERVDEARLAYGRVAKDEKSSLRGKAKATLQRLR